MANTSPALINKRMSWLAVVSLCASYLFFTAPLGIILGFVAKSEINNNENTLRGRGVANAAIIIGFASFAYIAIAYYNYTENVKAWERVYDINIHSAQGVGPRPEFKLFP